MRFRLGAALAVFLFPALTAGAFGLGLPLVAAGSTGVTFAIVAAILVSRRLLLATGFAFATRRWLAVTAAVGTIGAAAQIFPLTVFMTDSNRVEYSTQPSDPFRTRHSCMTSYAEGARFASDGSVNIYELALYQPRRIGTLQVDRYHYPPPFLLLPQSLHLAAPEFGSFRALWFAMQLLIIIGGFVAAATWIGGVAGATVLTGGALVMAMPNVVYSLQQGNFQISAMPLGVAGFALLLAGRMGTGAALVAWTAGAKIFPGILVVHLVAARRWRALGWLAAAGVMLLGLTIAVQGVRPLGDFFATALPEMADGSAFPHAERPDTVANNWTVYGLTVRLRTLGAASLTQPVGLSIASIYGIVVIGLAALAGWHRRLRIDTPAGRLAVLQVAVALIGLASFRSPFAGASYGTVSTLCLMALLAAGTASYRDARLWMVGLVIYGLSVSSIPSPAHAPTARWLLLSGGLFMMTVGLNVWVALRAVRSSGIRPDEAGADATYIVPTPGATAASAAPM